MHYLNPPEPNEEKDYCAWCHKWPFGKDKRKWIWDEEKDVVFCSKTCQNKFNNPKAINNYTELGTKAFSVVKDTLDELEKYIDRRIYKSTDCGAWLRFTDLDGYDAIEVGSIVEGVEQCAEPNRLAFPFLDSEFWKAVDNIEEQCTEIWNNTHGCEQCPMDEYECFHIINPNCPNCKGEGVIL